MRKTTARKLMVMAGLVVADANTEIGKKAAATLSKSGFDLTFERALKGSVIMIYATSSSRQAASNALKKITGVAKGDRPDRGLEEWIATEVEHSSQGSIQINALSQIEVDGTYFIELDLEDEDVGGVSAVAIVINPPML